MFAWLPSLVRSKRQRQLVSFSSQLLARGRLQDAEAITPAYLTDGQPDWSAIDFEVRCGRCDYNLRMLPEPRCPECGRRARIVRPSSERMGMCCRQVSR